MCGISGILAEQLEAVPEAAAVGLREAIHYRGRDEQGEWSDGRRISMFHSRLAIIDPAHGKQPMRSDDGRLTLVHSGEIYNFHELREQYERAGIQFRTSSDTEVLLAGYRLHGRRVLEHLNGMFAFAVWDAARQELFLARDQLGKKPLFWCSIGRNFFFSSTLDGFKALPGWTGALSRPSVAQYGVLGGFPESETVYEQARALPWACSATVKPASGPSVERYWRMDFSRKARGGRSELDEEYLDLLTDATRIRLRSDVPLALTFSGGVDSGSIAWACSRRLQTPLACYTVDYDTREEPSAEKRVAESAARHLGLDWRHIQFDYRSDVLGGLHRAYRHFDQPCQQLALVYSRRLYREIKPYATVVLSGNGGDELFTGYVGDERTRRRDLLRSATRWARPLLARTPAPDILRLPPTDAFTEALTGQAAAVNGDASFVEATRASAEAVAAEARQCGVSTLLDQQMFIGLTCSTIDSNFRVPDICGLDAQVEVRSPFLDHRMVEFACRLPHSYKVRRPFSPRGNKWLPRQSYSRMVPPEVANAPKRGMGASLRWDLSIAHDPEFRRAFAESFDRVEAAGLNAERFRAAWRAYVADVEAGRPSSQAGLMMNGFMLGEWLAR